MSAWKLLNAALLSVTLSIAGCGGSGDGSDGDDIQAGCSTDERNHRQAIHRLMSDVYYWYRDMPDVDPADYATPGALLDVLTQPEANLGHRYSYLTTVEEEEAFLNNAAYVGFGFSSYRDATGRLFLREVFPGSATMPGPAYAAGMRRGDEITHISGVAVPSMSTTELNNALGPSEEGYEVRFDVTHPDAGTDSYTVAKAELVTPVVGDVRHDLGTAKDTTYIFFRSFVNPAFNELDAAFAAMKAAGDTKLVLDMRYNGGGLVDVAGHLGGLIAGADEEGEVIAKLEFNDRYQSENVSYFIERLENTVDVTDLAVITTEGTASASEMIINGLEPFSDTLDVFTIGSTSYGKPVGQSRLEFCTTEILRAVTFKVVNRDDEGEYYTGIQPTCPADDDILHALGDPAEASLASALYRLENGSCDAIASTKAARAHAKRLSLQPEGNPMIRDGWDLLTGGAR